MSKDDDIDGISKYSLALIKLAAAHFKHQDAAQGLATAEKDYRVVTQAHSSFPALVDAKKNHVKEAQSLFNNSRTAYSGLLLELAHIESTKGVGAPETNNNVSSDQQELLALKAENARIKRDLASQQTDVKTLREQMQQLLNQRKEDHLQLDKHELTLSQSKEDRLRIHKLEAAVEQSKEDRLRLDKHELASNQNSEDRLRLDKLEAALGQNKEYRLRLDKLEPILNKHKEDRLRLDKFEAVLHQHEKDCLQLDKFETAQQAIQNSIETLKTNALEKVVEVEVFTTDKLSKVEVTQNTMKDHVSDLSRQQQQTRSDLEDTKGKVGKLENNIKALVTEEDFQSNVTSRSRFEADTLSKFEMADRKHLQIDSSVISLERQVTTSHAKLNSVEGNILKLSEQQRSSPQQTEHLVTIGEFRPSIKRLAERLTKLESQDSRPGDDNATSELQAELALVKNQQQKDSMHSDEVWQTIAELRTALETFAEEKLDKFREGLGERDDLFTEQYAQLEDRQIDLQESFFKLSPMLSTLETYGPRLDQLKATVEELQSTISHPSSSHSHALPVPLPNSDSHALSVLMPNSDSHALSVPLPHFRATQQGLVNPSPTEMSEKIDVLSHNFELLRDWCKTVPSTAQLQQMLELTGQQLYDIKHQAQHNTNNVLPDLKTLESALQALQRNISGVHAHLAGMDRSIVGIHGIATAASGKIDHQANVVDQLSRELNWVQATMNASFQDVQRKLEDTNGKLGDVQGKHNVLLEKQDAVSAENGSLRLRHDGLRHTLDGLRDKHDSLQARYDELRNMHNDLQASRDGIRESHDGFLRSPQFQNGVDLSQLTQLVQVEVPKIKSDLDFCLSNAHHQQQQQRQQQPQQGVSEARPSVAELETLEKSLTRLKQHQLNTDWLIGNMQEAIGEIQRNICSDVTDWDVAAAEAAREMEHVQ